MRNIIMLCLLLCLAVACRDDVKIVPMQRIDTGGHTTQSDIIGMYLLNEGNMGSNKASLDFLNLSAADSTVVYLRNIYAERNPSTVMQLGDVGNDAQIYGSRLWLVVNCSNKVEVARAADATRIGQVDIANCRYVTFADGFAYVSSYVGGQQEAGSSIPRGSVYKVDTLTLQKVDSVSVGYQPEEMAIVGERLYIANSGGYQAMQGYGYEYTISEVNLSTMQQERQIEVALNLHHVKADRYGQLWVSSRGDYNDASACLYWLTADERGEMQVGGCIDVPVSNFCIVGDSLYYYGQQWNEATMTSSIGYGIIDIRHHSPLPTSLFAAPEIQKIRMPYGIIVNPIHRDFYLMDAKNFVSSGELLHFLADGSFDWKVKTGDIPAHAVFLRKNE